MESYYGQEIPPLKDIADDIFKAIFIDNVTDGRLFVMYNIPFQYCELVRDNLYIIKKYIKEYNDRPKVNKVVQVLTMIVTLGKTNTLLNYLKSKKDIILNIETVLDYVKQ